MVWANDNKTLFYVTKDKLDRPFKVRGTVALHTPGWFSACMLSQSGCYLLHAQLRTEIAQAVEEKAQACIAG